MLLSPYKDGIDQVHMAVIERAVSVDEQRAWMLNFTGGGSSNRLVEIHRPPQSLKASNAQTNFYLANFLAPTTQRITATVTPSMPMLTCS